jgi:small GTP-binding protein
MVLLGDPYVGKSSFVERLCLKKFSGNYNSTLGAGFFTKILDIGDSKVAFEIWDTAGQERYRSLVPMYYKNADVVVIFFDLSNLNTFKTADYWDKELEKSGGNDLIKVIVGNKLDLYKNNISKYNRYYKISVKDNINIDKLMNHIFNELKDIKLNDKVINSLNIIPNYKTLEKKNKCC